MKKIISRTIELTYKVKDRNTNTRNVSVPTYDAEDIEPSDKIIVKAISYSDGSLLGSAEYTGSEFHNNLVARTKKRGGRVVGRYYTIRY